ncbi:GNAT family N-acetyltransferase [Salinibaculum rarum]|uniref:GNAT family N-acetyltransferase n=1 Tax=Salinibaculum rarum TaxID=3058903 RepID=UPI00265F4527|nr:N-acetyltransferase [Salinibaculum sp. KK48]
MTEIREGRPDDLPRLRAIQSALAEPWPELLATATEGPPPLYVLVDGQPVGYALVVGEQEAVAYVPEFAVHPDQQGQGYGSQLMAWLCERLTGEYDEIRLTVQESDERAQEFYRAHEFEQLERLADHFESGDGLLLARPLSD